MINSIAVSVVSEASHRTTAGAVRTKLCTFRWILNKTEVTMSHYSSKINYRGVAYQSNLWRNGLHFTSQTKVWGSILSESKFSFSFFFSLFLTFFKSICFPSFFENAIAYFKVISYRTNAFFFPFPNLNEME